MFAEYIPTLQPLTARRLGRRAVLVRVLAWRSAAFHLNFKLSAFSDLPDRPMHPYRLIIPTYQAQPHLAALLPALKNQGLDPRAVLVIDSSSNDDTVKIFRDFGADVRVIPKAEFNHGGTRRKAVSLCGDSELLILLTQDAIPTAGAFGRLLHEFENPSLGLAYGRQLPRQQARAIERHARLANYPPAPAQVRSFGDRFTYGIKTIFCSNSFAAYRRSALEAVGGFPEDAFFAEDQITAGRMLESGWNLAYVPEAGVVHSHGHSPLDDFRRYFDVGVFHARNPWLLETFGTAEGEGMKFVRSELRYLLHEEPLSIASAFLRSVLKYVGYRAGRAERWLAPWAKARLSMAPHYWRAASGSSD